MISTSNNPAISSNAAITPPTAGPAILLELPSVVVRGEASSVLVLSGVQKSDEPSVGGEVIALSLESVLFVNL